MTSSSLEDTLRVTSPVTDQPAPRTPVLGTVRWFNLAKGYGFITADGGDEVFVRFTAIESDGLRALSDGQRVEFDLVSDDSGLQAACVRQVA